MARWNRYRMTSPGDWSSPRAAPHAALRAVTPGRRDPRTRRIAAWSMSPARTAETTRITRSMWPRSRAHRSRISSEESTGRPWRHAPSGAVRRSREQVSPGRRGLAGSPATAANTGVCSGSLGRAQPRNLAPVTCVNRASSGSTASHARRSRQNSSSCDRSSRSRRNSPWLTRRKPLQRSCPRIGSSASFSSGMAERMRGGVERETVQFAACGSPRGRGSCCRLVTNHRESASILAVGDQTASLRPRSLSRKSRWTVAVGARRAAHPWSGPPGAAHCRWSDRWGRRGHRAREQSARCRAGCPRRTARPG